MSDYFPSPTVIAAIVIGMLGAYLTLRKMDKN
jgi:hypothetical protein